ncbi:TetR/AcrR family transcriptional regulator [Pandoraea pulmonicola]|uniref:HTH-type transcriptional repressor Bm3R1 n=2 Tax=Pandoraea pulmonicola TaxID=93221 RepID=A0AAJ4ZFS3_PANPU|nr:TetR/AcrR family transcriptional regulator [Pandoraea pulmonicola]SUA92478.1 HTH-type transcriptional repressor Bm3R1 [Pandoraea pulmonicola]
MRSNTPVKKAAASNASSAPRTKPAEVRLEELMAAAEALFLEKGVDAATVSEITERAKVAKGTFYHYFASKTDMLEALKTRYTRQFLAQLESAVRACAPDDWPQRLRVWIRTTMQTYVATHRTHDMVYASHHHYDRTNAERNAILEQLTDILTQGEAAGAWRSSPPRVLALILYSGVHGATDELIGMPRHRHEAFIDAVTQACLRMVDVGNVPASAAESPKDARSRGRSA